MADAKIYKIQKGDTLSKIAKEFDTTVENLKNTNNIQDINLIIAGDELQIPLSSSSEISGTTPETLDLVEDTASEYVNVDEIDTNVSDDSLRNEMIYRHKNNKIEPDSTSSNYGQIDQSIVSEYEERYKNKLPQSLDDYNHHCARLARQQLYVNGFLKDEGQGVNGVGLASHYAKNSQLLLKGSVVGYPSTSATQIDVFEGIIDDNDGNLKNLMLSFNQGGSFPDSAGHAVLISEIKDGIVYFADSFGNSAWGTSIGTCNALTIAQFENTYLKPGNTANYMTHFVDNEESAYPNV